ncbi:GDP-L-fucose synthase [Rubritalea halochordaticola]|uniref:GDP-L-fucose synthase n=1 Tax=Rubritalea halochordaticola TaxID=714537 RepID=A0ABP9V0J0_9BACT
MSKTILVIGGSGCVGRNVIEVLMRDHPECRVILLSRGIASVEQRQGVTWVRGDILDKDSLLDVMRKFEVTHILHAAGMRTSDCKADPVRAMEVNVAGTVNVLDSARMHGAIERLVFLSTAAVYEVPDGEEFLDEGAKTSALNAYTASKLAAEATVECYARSYGLRCNVLRPQIIYGPGREGEGSTAGVSVAIREAAAGRKYTIPFQGRTYFHYTKDVGIYVVRSLLESRGDYAVYNLPGESLDVEEIADTLNQWAGRELIDCTPVSYPFAQGLVDTKFREAYPGVVHTPLDAVLESL